MVGNLKEGDFRDSKEPLMRHSRSTVGNLRKKDQRREEILAVTTGITVQDTAVAGHTQGHTQGRTPGPGLTPKKEVKNTNSKKNL